MDIYIEDHTQPDPTISDSFGNEIDTSGQVFFPDAQIKKKRARRPWVYKSEYDRLQNKYSIVTWIAWAGWTGFLISIKILLW